MLEPAILLSMALLGAPSAPAPSPTARLVRQDLHALVEAEARSAAERPVEELWSRALTLRDAEALGEEGELDRVLGEVLASSPDPHATLLLVTARLLGDDPDHAALAEALLPLLDAPEDVATSAAALLADVRFRSLPSHKRDDLVEQLLAGSHDGTRAPAVRLAFATAAYQLGASRERRDAMHEMREFFNSSDALLRADGALALAGTGTPIEGKLRRVLEELERIPDERGRRAAALLKQEGLKELYERRLGERKDAPPDDLEELDRVLDMIVTQHLEGGKVKRHDLIEAAMDGMLRWMDPHSAYLSSEAYADFYGDLEAEYGGIGAYVQTDQETELFTIVRPIYSGPAYKAGLRTDDVIVRVGDWPTLDHDTDEVIGRLKGEPGTSVKLYVWRRGMDTALIERPTEDMAVTVERAQIDIPAGAFQMLPGQIGLVELLTFSRKATLDTKDHIEKLLADGMRALVLDLRNDQGGLLTQAREVADLFLPAGKVVVTTEGRHGEPQVHRTQTEPLVPADMPLIVLTNRFTASAAEIVAGALQDHGRAQLVGKRTFGKGSVQQLLEVPGLPQDEWRDTNGNEMWDPGEEILVDHDGDGVVDYRPRVKLTVARYLLPSGRSIHRELDENGEIVQEGGVQPENVVDERTYDLWRVREMRRVEQTGAIRDFVDERWESAKDLLTALAVSDHRDPTLYPGFDELMAGLSTSLSRDDVRRLVRSEVRRRVQDDQGFEFPQGDFVEDPQLQKAIELALTDLGEKPDDVPDFALVFDTQAFQEHAAGGDLAALRPETSAEVRRALSLILEAREGGASLSAEQLDELTTILEGIEHD